jgi:hypothetical protein
MSSRCQRSGGTSSSGRPGGGGVGTARGGLALADERLDAAGALGVGQRLSGRLAEQLR